MHLNTPLIESLTLSKITGKHVWVKMEALQPSGSFKSRGIGFACKHYFSQGARRFVSSSGGNAGLAVAYAGRELEIPVTVVVPKLTSQRAIDLISLAGAQVIVSGASWLEAHNHAQSLLDRFSAYLHPFDDPLIWQGNSTIIDEVIQANLVPDCVILSVGGGGLLCGVAIGLDRYNLSKVPVITCETHGADSLSKSILANRPIELDQITSISPTLGVKRVATEAFNVSKTHNVISEVVSDRDAVDACLSFAKDHRIITEPACGAALAIAYKNMGVLSNFNNILLIACGGSGVTYDELVKYSER